MEEVETMVTQDYLRYRRIVEMMEAELQMLPEGHLTYRTVSGHRYCYLQFMEHGIRKNKSIPKLEAEAMHQAIARRKALKQGIEQLQRCEKALERIFPQLRSLKPSNATNMESNLMSEDPEKPYRTLKGDYVRSKSELIIANELYSNHISYTYEQPLLLNGYQYPIHPDFTISVPGSQGIVYWEHCGLMNDPEYRGKWQKKKQAYERSGISEWQKNLIVTYESQAGDLDIDEIRQLIARLPR